MHERDRTEPKERVEEAERRQPPAAPETAERPAPGVKHEPEPDAGNLIPVKHEPGTF